MFYHSKGAAFKKGKTRWIIPENGEFEVFKISNEGNWLCNINNGYFSLVSKCAEILGDHNERLAFFPQTVNPNDPYHGYPVSSQDYPPSDTLVDKWFSENIIDEVTKRRIERRVI